MQVYDFTTETFEQVPWSLVEVGSLVRVTTLDDGCSPLIPCDLALLATSNVDGTAFLETANLDGETNLKVCMCACVCVCTANLSGEAGLKYVCVYVCMYVRMYVCMRVCVSFVCLC
jgi:magnesium-transporting ATPase (P-type)